MYQGLCTGPDYVNGCDKWSCSAGKVDTDLFTWLWINLSNHRGSGFDEGVPWLSPCGDGSFCCGLAGPPLYADSCCQSSSGFALRFYGKKAGFPTAKHIATASPSSIQTTTTPKHTTKSTKTKSSQKTTTSAPKSHESTKTITSKPMGKTSKTTSSYRSSPTFKAHSSYPGLSVGNKIAIGIGVPTGVIALIALFFAILTYTRPRRKTGNVHEMRVL